MVATERNGKKTLFGQYGKLSVKNGHLVGEDGSYVQLKGVSTHNMNSFPEFVNDDAIEFMADNWGMQLFRLAMYFSVKKWYYPTFLSSYLQEFFLF